MLDGHRAAVVTGGGRDVVIAVIGAFSRSCGCRFGQ